MLRDLAVCDENCRCETHVETEGDQEKYLCFFGFPGCHHQQSAERESTACSRKDNSDEVAGFERLNPRGLNNTVPLGAKETQEQKSVKDVQDIPPLMLSPPPRLNSIPNTNNNVQNAIHPESSAISKCKKKQEKQDLRPHLVRYYLACCRRVVKSDNKVNAIGFGLFCFPVSEIKTTIREKTLWH